MSGLGLILAGLKWLAGGPLDRLLSTVERKVDSETERERIKAQTVEAYVAAQATVLAGRGWWFPLFFLAPIGLHVTAVALYSVFLCQRCAFPQTWTVAALPPPFDEWEGVIVTSLFIGKAGELILAKFKK